MVREPVSPDVRGGVRDQCGRGYGVAVGTQMAVFPFFGIEASLSDNLAIGAIFTVVSLVRSYALRRLFNRWTRRA